MNQNLIRNVILEDILNTPDDSDIGYFLEVDLSYPNIKKTKNFAFFPENKTKAKNDFNEYKKKNLTKNLYMT